MLFRSEAIPANGHTYNHGTVEKEPTCEEDGIRVCECLVCTRKQTVRLTKLGHELDDGTEVPQMLSSELQDLLLQNIYSTLHKHRGYL